MGTFDLECRHEARQRIFVRVQTQALGLPEICARFYLLLSVWAPQEEVKRTLEVFQRELEQYRLNQEWPFDPGYFMEEDVRFAPPTQKDVEGARTMVSWNRDRATSWGKRRAWVREEFEDFESYALSWAALLGLSMYPHAANEVLEIVRKVEKELKPKCLPFRHRQRRRPRA